jgi:HD-like signal output (HDOD) protein
MAELKKCHSCGREFRTEADFLSGTTRWRICNQGHLWFNCSCHSTLLITKGKYDWYSPEKAMSAEASTVFNKLSNLKDLPHFPSQVLEIQKLVGDPKATPKQIAEAIKRDPIGATQLLTIAENIRSSRSPGNPPMHSLEHAIVYLGLKSVGELIVASALRQFKFPESDFDFEQFWQESQLSGSIAEYLNAFMELNLNQDEVYLAASMANLGKLVTAYSFPALATKIQHDVTSTSAPVSWRNAEKNYKFPDHRILGEIAVSIWGFPVYIAEAARRHHDVLDVSSRDFSLTELVSLSNQLVHWILLAPSRIEESILKSFYNKTGMRERDFETVVKDLGKLHRDMQARTTGH